MATRDVEVYDTTLRDGAQQEGMNLSVGDKMAIAPLLDELGVDVIEGGWPGAIPKDTEFFALAHKELKLAHATFAAFGATRKPGTPTAQDAQVRALLDAEAPVITLVAKSDIRHVELALKTTGDIRERARAMAEKVVLLVIVLGATFLLWTQFAYGKGWTWVPVALGAGGLIFAALMNRSGREGLAFIGTGITVAAAVVLLFGCLYPNVMPSTTSAAFNLTIHNASSTPYTLRVMTWVALIFTPIVLCYQAWTYWVFRKRIGTDNLPAVAATAPAPLPEPATAGS